MKQNKKNKKIKYKEGDVVAVTWLDAFGSGSGTLLEISTTPSELLIETVTYGILHKFDSGAVTIIQEESPLTYEYTVVPFGMIKNINILQKRRLK